MKRVMALLLLAALPGCGGMPIDGTDLLRVRPKTMFGHAAPLQQMMALAN